MNITMPRGDIRHVSFSITNNLGEVADVDFEDIYFTVKESFTRDNYLFQKKLSDGSITKEDDNYWFTIQPEDTDNLQQNKTYVFDIELVNEADEIKQTFTGELKITNEATHHRNE